MKSLLHGMSFKQRHGMWIGFALALFCLSAPLSAAPDAPLAADSVTAGARTLSPLLIGLLGGGLLAGLAAIWWNRKLRHTTLQSTRKLHENSEYVQSILNSINDAVFVIDADTTRILDVNQRMCELYGYRKEQALQGRIADFSEGQAPFAQADIEGWLRKARDEGPQSFPWRSRRANGELFWTEAGARTAVIGGHLHGVMIVHDITDRKQAEAELIESAERFRALIDTVPDLAIHGYLMDGTAIYWNETCTRLYGYTAEEAIGRNILELIIPPELHDAVRDNIKAMELGAASIPPGELLLQRKDGSRVHVYSGYALSLPPGRPPQFFCMDIDLSERIRSEEERQDLQDKLAQAQKMELVGRLAGGVAHDFNNMLGVIIGYVELAMDQADPNDPVYHDLKEVRKAADRSTDLTRQLLAYARKQPVSPQVLDLNHNIAGSLKMLRRLIGEDLKLLWNPTSDLWPVKLDPVQIDQILANLCVNARDAIHGVGQITIQTGNRSPEGEDPPGLMDGDFVWLTVSDTGPGIPQEVLEHIFEPFFTTKDVGRGTGLGLATVYGIVKQNNGHIDVKSAPGQGTTFTIYLPRYRGPMSPSASSGNGPSEGTTDSRRTLLLVEDEPSLLHLCQSYLKRLGYTVLATTSPTEALQLAKTHPDPIHLLITDVVMPEMNGPKLAGELTRLFPDLQTLFMSGYTADMIAQHGVLQDGIHFLQKPFSNSDLAAKVQAVLVSEAKAPTPGSEPVD